MQRGNPERLIPNSKRTPEELRAMTSKGGKRSVEVRREKKLLSQIYGEMLAETFDVKAPEGDAKKRMSGQAFVQAVAKEIIERRDSASVSMLKEIREATEGQKHLMQGEIVALHGKLEGPEAERIAEELASVFSTKSVTEINDGD